jgi:hypothetical protein
MAVLLTPSAAYGCISLLTIVERQKIDQQHLVTLNFGPIATRTIVEHAKALDWVSVNTEGYFFVTERGRLCLQLSQTKRQLRLLLKEYFLRRRDPWLQLAKRGRMHVLLQSPPEILQLFHEAGLAGDVDQETIEFWDDLASLTRKEGDKKNTETGRVGERMSVQFEHERTGFEPKWMALESNHYGYDILTRVSDSNETPLKIETKCSLASVSRAKFHLTKFEWQTAERSNNYSFHIWSVSEKATMLAVLNVAQVAPHIPKNQHGGLWETVEIPFRLFDFVSIPVQDNR